CEQVVEEQDERVGVVGQRAEEPPERPLGGERFVRMEREHGEQHRGDDDAHSVAGSPTALFIGYRTSQVAKPAAYASEQARILARREWTTPTQVRSAPWLPSGATTSSSPHRRSVARRSPCSSTRRRAPVSPGSRCGLPRRTESRSTPGTRPTNCAPCSTARVWSRTRWTRSSRGPARTTLVSRTCVPRRARSCSRPRSHSAFTTRTRS